MTMVCPSGRIRPDYLFICISTACDGKKSGYLRIDDVYLRSDTSGNEWVMGLWGERPTAPYAVVFSLKRPRSDSVTIIIWYVGCAWWFRAYASVLWSRSDRVIIWVSGGLSMSAEAEYMHLDFCFAFWSVRLLIDLNIINVCVSVRCIVVVFYVCILYCDV